MFDKNSGLVQIWVRLVLAGTPISKVPQISNLRQKVQEVIEDGSNND